jgi:hypothetical protein
MSINMGRTESRRENWSETVLAGATKAIFTYRVPGKSRFRWFSFGNYLGTVAAWGTAYWYYKVDGVRKEFCGTYAIYDQIGYAAQRQTITEEEIGGSSVIEIVAVNPTGADLQMGISVEYELIHQE